MGVHQELAEESTMFDFLKRNRTPKPPRKQGYILNNGEWGTLDESKRTRYEGHSNTLCVEGTCWPPVLKDDSMRDRGDLFRLIAFALNNISRYRPMLAILKNSLENYKAGKTTALKVAQDVEKLLTVIENLDRGEGVQTFKRDAKAEHGWRAYPEYEA